MFWPTKGRPFALSRKLLLASCAQTPRMTLVDSSTTCSSTSIGQTRLTNSVRRYMSRLVEVRALNIRSRWRWKPWVSALYYVPPAKTQYLTTTVLRSCCIDLTTSLVPSCARPKSLQSSSPVPKYRSAACHQLHLWLPLRNTVQKQKKLTLKNNLQLRAWNPMPSNPLSLRCQGPHRKSCHLLQPSRALALTQSRRSKWSDCYASREYRYLSESSSERRPLAAWQRLRKIAAPLQRPMRRPPKTSLRSTFSSISSTKYHRFTISRRPTSKPSCLHCPGRSTCSTSGKRLRASSSIPLSTTV